MKANELMIGDWVRVGDNETTQVTDIVTDHREMLFGVSCADRATYDAGDLQPVPLTAEILINNGFEHNETTYWGERYSLVYQPNGVNYNDIFELVPSYGELHEELDYMWFPASSAIPALVIKYVHELQHALRLCGIEKEVVL